MTSLAALLLLSTVVVGFFGSGVGTAHAQTQGEYAGRLTFRLSDVRPVVVTAEGPRQLTLVGRYTNTGPDPIDKIEFRFQRGNALTTANEVAAEAESPSQPTEVMTRFRPLPGRVEPGESAAFAISVPVFDRSLTAPVTTPGSSEQAEPGDSGRTEPGDSGRGSLGSGTSAGAGPATDEPSVDSLGVAKPGVYPLMMNINAAVHVGDAKARARVGELHVLLTVASVPTSGTDADQHPGTPDNATGEQSTGGDLGTGNGSNNNGDSGANNGSISGNSTAHTHSTPISILWPLADRPHLGVGGVFSDDELAKEIHDGGRLATALGALQVAHDPDLITLVVDPMLLDELQRMADGYRVLADPDAAGPRLRADGAIPDTVAGTGQAAAAAYLDELRSLAATHRVLVLAYGDADLVALTRAGLADEARFAVSRGRDIATRVLVRGPEASAIYAHLVTTIAAPTGGVMTSDAAALLAGIGDDAVVLSPGSVAHTNGSTVSAGLVALSPGVVSHPADTGDPRGPESSTDPINPAGSASPADPDMYAIVTGGDRAATFAQILGGAIPQDKVRALNVLAAELVTAPATARTPIVIAPPRQFSASRQGLAELTQLIASLSDSRTLVPTPLTTLVRSGANRAAAPKATLTYSDSNRRAELPIPYLRRVADLHDRIDSLNSSLGRAPVTAGGADPQQVLLPLTQALLPAVSSTWRGSADPAAATLETVNSTLTWLYGGVQISRDSGSYTLASSSAPLLLTVKNALPYEVTVKISIVGGAQTGLAATDPGAITIGAGPRSVPVKLETTVSRSGTFTVFAQLHSADGSTWAGAVPLTIDSRAYGALTIILMASAAGVLFLMVIWRLVQRIRGRIDDPGNATVDTPGLSTDGITIPGVDNAQGANDVISNIAPSDEDAPSGENT